MRVIMKMTKILTVEMQKSELNILDALSLIDGTVTCLAKLEKDLYKTANWSLEHQLLINPDKTKFLLAARRSMLQNLPTQINLNFLGKTLKPVTVVKDLGMHLDLHLSYDDHISKLSSTGINKLCQISRVKESFDKENFNITYRSFGD